MPAMQEARRGFSIPWEDRRAFFLTIRELVVHPYAFASGFPSGEVKPALAFSLLVQVTSILATSVTTAVVTGRPSALFDALGRETEKSFWLVGLALIFAVFVHPIARHTGNDSRLSDSVRIAAYTVAAYTLLRLAVLPLFVLKLEQTQVGGALAFVLWAGPLAFGVWFMIVAIRHRYQRSLGMAILSVVGVALVLLIVFAVTWQASSPIGTSAVPYETARVQFHSQLSGQGPAPQDYLPTSPPPGVTEVSYVSDGLQLKAWVSAPQAPRQPLSAVLFLHGGFAFSLEDWEMAKPYRDAGFVVLMPMLRGENGLPGNYSMFFHEIDDVYAAADTLAKLPYVRADRLYLAGHSVGGTLTMLAAMGSKRFRAASARRSKVLASGSTIQYSGPPMLA